MYSTQSLVLGGEGLPRRLGAPLADNGKDPPHLTASGLSDGARELLGRVLQESPGEIIEGWRAALRAAPNTQYRTLPPDELEASLRGILEGLSDFLTTADVETLGRPVAAVARVRFGQGFALGEVSACIGSMRAVLAFRLMSSLSSDPAAIGTAMMWLMECADIAADRIAEAYGEASAARIHAAHEEALRAQHDKVDFCREMARVATHDKLILCDHADIPRAPDVETFAIHSAADVRRVRHYAAAMAGSGNWSDARSYALQLCIGEAGTNAIRHAGAAAFRAWADEDNSVTFRISDAGRGIELNRIPAALRPGCSTGSSLGLGFTLMLELADRIYLATDDTGTTLQLTVLDHEPEG